MRIEKKFCFLFVCLLFSVSSSSFSSSFFFSLSLSLEIYFANDFRVCFERLQNERRKSTPYEKRKSNLERTSRYHYTEVGKRREVLGFAFAVCEILSLPVPAIKDSLTTR